MIRVLFFILVVFVFTGAAQTPFINQIFEAGNAAARNRQYEQAIEKYQATILRAGEEHFDKASLAKAHFNIGVCFYQLKQTREAVAEFKEAIRLRGREYQKAFYALGMAQKDLQNWREAEIALRDALKIEKKDGEAWFDLALVYLAENNLAAAKKAFENSISYESASAADAHNNLGVIAALDGDWTTAETEFKAALAGSRGESIEAAKNLQFCRFYKRISSDKKLLAELKFSRIKMTGE